MAFEIAKEELESLIADREYGEIAKNAKFFIDEYCKRVIDRCCQEFSTVEINYYQNIDNKAIYMLQLQMKMAKDIQTALDRAISDGSQAIKTLNERGIRHG